MQKITTQIQQTNDTTRTIQIPKRLAIPTKENQQKPLMEEKDRSGKKRSKEETNEQSMNR